MEEAETSTTSHDTSLPSSQKATPVSQSTIGQEALTQRFLTEATEALASSLDYEQTLQKVADLAVPHIADWCGVDMVEPDGSLRLLAVAHIDPEKVQWAYEQRRLYPRISTQRKGCRMCCVPDSPKSTPTYRTNCW